MVELAETNDDLSIKPLPEWVRSLEDSGLIAWSTRMAMAPWTKGAPGARGQAFFVPDEPRGDHGERMLVNEPTEAKNELYVDRDIMVLANPEISGLPDWVVALVPRVVWRRPSPPRRVCCWWCRPVFLTTLPLLPNISEKGELRVARIAIVCVVWRLVGDRSLGFVAEVWLRLAWPPAHSSP